MVFEELVELLKTVETLDDIPVNLFDELINASLAVGLHGLLSENRNMTEDKALLVLQSHISEHCLAISDSISE